METRRGSRSYYSSLIQRSGCSEIAAAIQAVHDAGLSIEVLDLSNLENTAHTVVCGDSIGAEAGQLKQQSTSVKNKLY